VSSIRVFLVVVILAVLTLFTFVAALKGYQSSMQEAELLFDKQLLDTARLIAGVQMEKAPGTMGQDSDIAFQVWHEDKLLASSSNAPVTAIAALTPGFDFSNFNGYRWRTIGYQDKQSQSWILVAERTDLRYTLAESVILKSILPVFFGLPVVALLIWLIVGQGLKPLRYLADELAHKRPDDLGPLSIEAPRNELKQIVASCNGLLDRLESSLQREKQFASDAAHELRTPISVLKVQLYNVSKELPEDSESINELAHTALRLEHIVEQILDLYKSSPDQFTASFVPIDLAALTQEVLAQEYSRFDRKDQHLEFEGDSRIMPGDRFALTTLIRNLLTNANKFTPAKGEISVRVKSRESGIMLTVEDSGPGIPEDQRRLVFDRFYRMSSDRNRPEEPGCGLGLAIVKRITELHRASIEVTSSRFESGTAIHVNFPVEPVRHLTGVTAQ
jgi:two-component system sensor histidine kinase QseC